MVSWFQPTAAASRWLAVLRGSWLLSASLNRAPLSRHPRRTHQPTRNHYSATLRQKGIATMGDQPWFKFYAADYLLDPDVDAIPRQAEALLVRMWCVCHREGSCPADPETLARKTLCSLQYILQFKPHCDPFFELQGGKLYSRRMQEEKQRSEKARKNANKRYEQKQHRVLKLNPESESESESERGTANGSATCSASRTATQSKASAHPTLEEVTVYCRERENQVDPQKWIDHYSANGWKVGRNPMKDWKAAVRTWERNGVDSTNGNGKPSITAVIEREQAIARARAS